MSKDFDVSLSTILIYIILKRAGTIHKGLKSSSTILIYIILKPQILKMNCHHPAEIVVLKPVKLNFTSIYVYYISRNGICKVQFLRFNKQQGNIMVAAVSSPRTTRYPN